MDPGRIAAQLLAEASVRSGRGDDEGAVAGAYQAAVASGMGVADVAAVAAAVCGELGPPRGALRGAVLGLLRFVEADPAVGPGAAEEALGGLARAVLGGGAASVRADALLAVVDAQARRAAAAERPGAALAALAQVPGEFWTPALAAERLRVAAWRAELARDAGAPEADELCTVAVSLALRGGAAGAPDVLRRVYAAAGDVAAGRGRFADAAAAYAEASAAAAKAAAKPPGAPGAAAGEEAAAEADLRSLRRRAAEAAVLAPPGPRRVRQLAKAAEAAGPPLDAALVRLLERCAAAQLLREEDMRAVARHFVLPVGAGGAGGAPSFSEPPDGGRFGRVALALAEHNLLAASRVYANIGFAALARLLCCSPAAVEDAVLQALSDGRLVGTTIDQVDGVVYFSTPAPAASLLLTDQILKSAGSLLNG